ncbi:DUF4410 domain-containing protein [Parachitinimonas caeni]|uniref:DUF4410 domain-containing protein n=1 Tax=Parachitinimonas caeni TaxID=3031301 RepID=A0ABT7DXB5_9NEIS|nr:DUF4410 domain-containing protein [Parachitinimonas caeni]MDK2124713.1 DUF4410 domain-containing protein [Parachitinimonas caeni]
MKKAITVLACAVSIVLGGCAGTAAVVRSEYRLSEGEKVAFTVSAPADLGEEARGILNARLTEKLTANSLLATTADASARELEIQVTNYRMRHGAARALLGIMAGTDNIQSTIKVKNKASGAVLSEFQIESKNPTAWGTSKSMIEEHADKIVDTLVGAKK